MSLAKKEWVNLPLSIEKSWQTFFENYAREIGCSRNAALCLALKLGGPVLATYAKVLKRQLKRLCDEIESAGDGKGSENLAPPLPYANGDTKHALWTKKPLPRALKRRKARL